MARITSVDVTLGVPTAGTGTVATLDGVFDATNGPVTTKAVSTAPVTATDKALVTVLRPDSPGIIATGTAGTPSVSVVSVQGVASGTAQNTKEVRSATGTQSIVAGSATSVTVLASNANRLGASVHNDSTAILYLLLTTGGTASSTVYSVKLIADAYFEVPFNYTGDLKGIWASATGNARVMEYA